MKMKVDKVQGAVQAVRCFCFRQCMRVSIARTLAAIAVWHVDTYQSAKNGIVQHHGPSGVVY